MYDTVQPASSSLSHDLPCSQCGHATHTYLACSDSCDCVPVRPASYARLAGAR